MPNNNTLDNTGPVIVLIFALILIAVVKHYAPQIDSWTWRWPL